MYLNTAIQYKKSATKVKKITVILRETVFFNHKSQKIVAICDFIKWARDLITFRESKTGANLQIKQVQEVANFKMKGRTIDAGHSAKVCFQFNFGLRLELNRHFWHTTTNTFETYSLLWNPNHRRTPNCDQHHQE